MSYEAYKLVHFLGIFTLLTVIAVVASHVLKGGTKADNPHHKGMAIVHGVAAVLALTGGFGMLARLGVAHGGLPGWAYLKLAIWLAFGAAPAIAYRGRRPARLVLVAAPLLAVVAGWVALAKPL